MKTTHKHRRGGHFAEAQFISLICFLLLISGIALHAQQPPGDGAERFRRMSKEAEERGLAEPFKGVTTDGKVVGGVVELAAQVGVPVLAVVGDVYDDADTRVETVALAARFGRERALADTLECVEQAVSEWLGARRCSG